MAELSAQGPIGLPQATTVATTDALIAAGTRARDAAGNEYLYVAFGETLNPGQWAVIRNGSALRLGATSRGSVGVVCATSTSLDYGWVQIYGVYDTAQLVTGTTDATSAYWLGGTADTTEAGAQASSVATLTTNMIFGAWPLAAATSAVTLSSSAHSGVTIQVQLNFPYVIGISPSEATAASS